MAVLALAVARLLRLTHPLAERLQAAHEIARLVGGAAERVLLRLLSKRRLGLADLPLQRVEVRGDVVFHRLRVVARRSSELAARVANLLAHPLVANRPRRVVQLARGLLLIAPGVVGQRLEIFLQFADLLVHRVLAVREVLRLASLSRRRLTELPDFRGDVLLFVRQFLGGPLGVLNVTLRAVALIAIELFLRLTQQVQRRRRLCAAVL